MMKYFLAFALAFTPLASIADDPVATLYAELKYLDTASPETDAARDIANGQAVCFSINSYAKYFPGTSDQHQEYCAAREKNFRGTQDVSLTKEHADLSSHATQYAKRYNAYVLHQRN